MSDLDMMQRRVGQWADGTFTQSTSHSIATHLQREATELRGAVFGVPLATDAHAEEAADCLLLLLHLAHREGFSLWDAAAAKHAVNIVRDWSAPPACREDEEMRYEWKHLL